MGKKKSTRTQREAEAKIKKYYDEQEAVKREKAATDAKRLQEDLVGVMRDAGIANTRAIEDYTRNIGNIEANKASDITELNDYVKTNTGRTQEDLDTSLAKETRRHQIAYDQINQGLADSGLTFSDRKPEKIEGQQTAANTTDINMTAARSFADINRYETAKNADIALKYGQQTADAEATKTRTLEDIMKAQNDATTKINRGEEDVNFNLAQDTKALSYAKDTDVATTGQLFDQQAQTKKLADEQRALNG